MDYRHTQRKSALNPRGNATFALLVSVGTGVVLLWLLALWRRGDSAPASDILLTKVPEPNIK